MAATEGSFQRRDLRIDVTAAVRTLTPTEIAITVFLPDTGSLPARPVAIFAVPGGGYSRGYFDMHFPAHADYSEAEFHARHGFIFIACDPVGVGDSSLPDLASITYETFGSTHNATVTEVSHRLLNGTLVEGFPALPQLLRIGIGQSMGGKITVLTQGQHQTFDGIAVLGASAIHTVLPQRTPAAYEASKAAHQSGRGSMVHARSVHESSREIADFVYPFHWEDIPKDILDADMRGGYPIRSVPPPPFGSLTTPPCAVTMMSPGAIAPEAAAVKVPVLVAVGERDTCPHPLAEPAAYGSSTDVSVFVVSRMAHMHNFASTRHQLWRRIESWIGSVSDGLQ